MVFWLKILDYSRKAAGSESLREHYQAHKGLHQMPGPGHAQATAHYSLLKGTIWQYVRERGSLNDLISS